MTSFENQAMRPFLKKYTLIRNKRKLKVVEAIIINNNIISPTKLKSDDVLTNDNGSHTIYSLAEVNEGTHYEGTCS